MRNIILRCRKPALSEVKGYPLHSLGALGSKWHFHYGTVLFLPILLTAWLGLNYADLFPLSQTNSAEAP